MPPMLTELIFAFILTGKATWYDEPGCLTRDESQFQADGYWCAVDRDMYGELRGRRIFCYGREGFGILPVKDSGNLSGWGVVVDLPKDTFREVFGTSDTQSVNVYLIESKRPYKRRMELWGIW